MNAIVLLAALTVFRVDPWFHKPILPDADPEEGVVTDTLSFAAAKGEIEAISFVVKPDADYAKVDVVPSDLIGPGDAKIPASAADVALVKVWFRPGGRWISSWKGDQANPEPINNLVLHDDALIKVDWENKVNYLRGEYPDGVYYMDISRRDLDTHFNHDCEPVKDAPKFVPFDLKKGFRQQYLVTWKIPKEAEPGDYKGTITLSIRNSQLSTLNLSLTVYPFALPRPRTHYDTREPYVSYWMGSPSLDGLLAEGHRLDRAEKKLRAIFRNMVEHNAINLSGVGDLKRDSTDDYALRTLLIARQEGMCADPMINGSAFDFSHRFVCVPGGGTAKDLMEPEEEPELYKESLAAHRDFVTKQSAIMDKYLGHHRCYYQSADECGYETNRRSYGYWSVIHELGGMTWTDYAYAKYNGVFVDMNDIPASIAHKTAWEWRRGGAKSVTYAGTFTGPENPDVWRRIKGLRFWYADYDGQHEYNFFDGRYNRWNDFVYRGSYCMFGIVYWTMDGMISTLAWEAVRESLDDVRYFTLLRLRAEAALKSSDAAVRRLGREALVWQDGVDPEYVLDLDAFRRETAEWIKRLVAKVGPQPADRDTELPPPAELPPDSRWQRVPKPSAGAKAVFDYAEKMSFRKGSWMRGEGRFDLALAALEGLYKDKATATPDRVRAAMRISSLYSALKERPAAIAVLEDALAIRDITNVDRGKLYLKCVNVMMTDEKYQEKYAVKHLDRASKALEDALKFSGASEEERAGAIMKMASGYLAAGEYEKCIEFAAARLKDTKIHPAHQAYIQITVGNAWKGKKDWGKALKAFDEAHRVFNNDKDSEFRRTILLTEAEAAEKAKDYVRAVHCWTDIIPTYDPVEQKDRINNAKRNVIRLQPLARKNSNISTGSLEDDDREKISLDE